jgi:hypothetical protein
VIDDRWNRYRAELEREVVQSLVAAAYQGESAARAKRPSFSYKIDQIKNQTKIGVPYRVPGGWIIDIRWTDFRSLFFEHGTYQKLGRRLSVRSKPGEAGNRGVKPQRFGRLARRVGRRALVVQLNRRLR